MQCELREGDWTLQYEWERKRIRNLNLRVREDGSIYVSSPMRVSAAAVQNFIRSRRKLIEEAQRRIAAERPAAEETLRDGTVIPCLGKSLVLCIVPGSKDSATLSDDRLLLTLRHPEDEKVVARVFHRWWDATC